MRELSEKLQAVLNSLPHKPGIYLHKDADGHVLYVGKATSLHQRVRQYFVDPSELSPKNRALVAKIADIEFIVVASEIEALILENEYIKQYQPKYNVRLRDDKNYPYIKVALTEDFPRVYRVRSFRRDGNRYFGPYTNSGAVDATLDLMNKLFPYRTCRYDGSPWAPPRGQEEHPPAEWKQKYLPRPCTQYYIHRCNAPCVGNATREQYDAVIRQVMLFLEGKHDEALADLKAQMAEAAENLEFERAAALRDRVRAVEQVLEKQKIINTTGPGDQDVVALAGADDETCAQVFFFRGGKLAGREYFLLQGTRDTEPGEIMASFLQQFYDSAPHIPAEVVVQHEPENGEALRQWLRQKRGAVVTLTLPQRGDKLRLVEMVAQNASEVLEQQRIKWLSDSQKTAMALEELGETLNLPSPPQRIECYDISNIQGTSAVGSMVVFEGGKPKTSDYRRFKIKAVEGQNDVASLQEVLRRRFKRLLTTGDAGDAQESVALEAVEPEGDGVEESVDSGDGLQPPDDSEMPNEEGASADAVGDPWALLPNLVMVDGGRPQLNAALAVLSDLAVGVPVIGIAKEDHGSISTHEEIYLVEQVEPLVMARGSQALYLLQRVRDEAHRFAITYHRQVRSTRTFRSLLDEIPGIGPKRKKALIRRFGSARGIAAASTAELAEVEGISADLAERIKEHIGAGLIKTE
ncbi:MAG: Excinuclease ABC subunit C [Ktedonobacterales bacterium]|jgi:excinuclease ABC subunit C|nr:MAG: Excinuclease ABC subunit C [Ktedonobacterales bacterium]